MCEYGVRGEKRGMWKDVERETGNVCENGNIER